MAVIKDILPHFYSYIIPVLSFPLSTWICYSLSSHFSFLYSPSELISFQQKLIFSHTLKRQTSK